MRLLVIEDDEALRESLCKQLVDAGFGISFPEYFAPELEALAGPGGAVEEGMAEIGSDRITATELGGVFIRNVAMVFDAYLADKMTGSTPVFSRTV
jgi:coproporphyrinogen III oxidase-like Fe-S oxidoreductase